MEEKRKLAKFVIDETIYPTYLTPKFENRKKYVPADPNKIFSIIPGLILSVHVKEGQSVKRGDDLLVLEAMKMKNSIAAPLDGKIKSVFVAVGEIVPKGFLLVEME